MGRKKKSKRLGFHTAGWNMHNGMLQILCTEAKLLMRCLHKVFWIGLVYLGKLIISSQAAVFIVNVVVTFAGQYGELRALLLPNLLAVCKGRDDKRSRKENA